MSVEGPAAPTEAGAAAVPDVAAVEKKLWEKPYDMKPMPEADLYVKFKTLQQRLEFLDIQEEYIKDEMKNLKRELIRAKEEITRIQSVPLVIGQFNEMSDANYGIVSSTAGSNYYVRARAAAAAAVARHTARWGRTVRG